MGAAHMGFSANLGFLWTDTDLLDGIRRSAKAGFEAVEVHAPYDTPAKAVRALLDETGQRMIVLNTTRGAPGENGWAALPGREAEARAAIDQAIAYAVTVGAGAVHVMAGIAEGAESEAVFLSNLRYARAAAPRDIDIMIEPLNRQDAPGYFLWHTDQAAQLLAQLHDPGIRMMFDCYHVARTEGKVQARLWSLLPLIGHIQIGAVPDRGAPDHGTLDYPRLVRDLLARGWTTPLGAEYRPGGPTEASLGWMALLRQPA